MHLKAAYVRQMLTSHVVWHLWYGTPTQANRLWCASFCCRNDPNYDSDEERTVLIAPNSSHTRLQEEVTAYKQEVSR